jgi:hypothetical protein
MEHAEIEWSSQLEKVVADEGEKCLSYGWLHDKAAKKYNKLDTIINIPVIVLSTITGSASIGSQSLFNGSSIAPVIIGLVSLFVGVLNTLGSYFVWAKRSENHRLSSISYNKHHNFIRIELSLPRMQRLRPEEMLKMIKEGLDRLNETAPEIPNDVIKEYKTLFGALTDISKPTICNGLHHIEVYSQVIEKQLESKRMSVEMLPAASSPVGLQPAVELLPVQNTMTKPEKKPWK